MSPTPPIRPLVIDGRTVGPGHPPYVVAELSANHRGSLEEAERLVRAAAATGADAVKLQTYTADTLTLDSDRPEFVIGEGSPWAGRTLHDLYEEAHTPWDWHPRLQQVAREEGITLFSTPFDDTAVDFLEELGMPAHKVASFELVDLALVRRIAGTGKPMILSTGMATETEIGEAVEAARGAGAEEIALLQCTSAYPAPPSEANLRTLPELSRRFAVPAGLSDHTPGWAVPVVAVALGACLIEKHMTLDRAAGGPDAAFSLEPEEFTELVRSVRTAYESLGQVRFGTTAAEGSSRVFRRSLFVVQDVAAGEEFNRHNVRAIRPGDGLAPRHLPQVLGRRAARDLKRGEPLAWELLAGPAP